MKTMTAQIGNEFDSSGACLAQVIVIAEGSPKGYDTAFVYWDSRAKIYEIGLTGSGRKNAPLFKQADLYCTCSMPYDMILGGNGNFITREDFNAACEKLGKPDLLKVVEGKYS